ncbi:MAG: radical SAM protein [Clostridia bacterium]|nr:radical SAM protein [Clostridia bacterium]
MGSYFRLNSYIRFEKKSTEACIYNLFNGDIIFLDEKKANIIEKCERNEAISNLNNDELAFLNKLEDMGIGRYYDRKVYVEKMFLGQEADFESTMKKNITFSRLFIEITNECNLDCLFCNYLDEKAYRKTGCKRWYSSGRNLSTEQYKEVIRQAVPMGVKEIVFMGGEPFLEYEKMKELIQYTKFLGVEKVAVYTNLTLLNEEILKIIKEFKVSLVVQVISNNKEEFECISNKPLEVDIIKNIRLLKNNNVAFSIKILVCRYNEDNIENMISELSRIISNNKIQLDFIYPHNKIHHSPKYLNYIYNKKSKLFRVNLPMYSFYTKYNNCFGNQIALTLDGDILPCIMTRKLKLGSIIEQQLHEILTDGKYEALQTLTKDKIQGCKECIYRFGCIDCRAIEMEYSNTINETNYCECVNKG